MQTTPPVPQPTYVLAQETFGYTFPGGTLLLEPTVKSAAVPATWEEAVDVASSSRCSSSVVNNAYIARPAHSISLTANTSLSNPRDCLSRIAPSLTITTIPCSPACDSSPYNAPANAPTSRLAIPTSYPTVLCPQSLAISPSLPPRDNPDVPQIATLDSVEWDSDLSEVDELASPPLQSGNISTSALTSNSPLASPPFLFFNLKHRQLADFPNLRPRFLEISDGRYQCCYRGHCFQLRTRFAHGFRPVYRSAEYCHKIVGRSDSLAHWNAHVIAERQGVLDGRLLPEEMNDKDAGVGLIYSLAEALAVPDLRIMCPVCSDSQAGFIKQIYLIKHLKQVHKLDELALVGQGMQRCR